MSRIGKLPVSIPAGVKVAAENGLLKVSGAQGVLSYELKPEITVDVQGAVATVKRDSESRSARSLHGLTRTLLSNMIKGVSAGFEKKLDIVGVGYKADVQGAAINLILGYSHPIKYELPKGIVATVEKLTSVTIKGADKQLVGQVAADIRAMRPPEPYKGKGIKYSNEVIRRKAGKAGKAAGGK